ncbi:hypothetical protein HX794_23775 [Pseudomonas costantinii]|uniref:hypothetical protein n=1 Tax=Pseudomonas costantinii TaxID=168469 RepID=UPI0015A3D60B|nr:hypothetical protein [Pseudomonas costantinii]NVZ22668.1 hypothetical protein [Pseudomonas costantinii]
MNAASLAQQNFDNRPPPPVSETSQEVARSEWLYSAAEDLLRGSDVSFQRRWYAAQGVAAKEFALAVDEHVNRRLANCEINTPSLGWLLIEAMRGRSDKTSAAELLGHSDHSLGKLGEIAEGLLRPLADDALIAQAEDNEL